MTPILKGIKEILTRRATKAAEMVESPQMRAQETLSSPEHHIVRSMQHLPQYAKHYMQKYIQPYFHDKSQSEIIFLTFILSALLLFVVIIPTYETRVRHAEEGMHQEVHGHSNRVVNAGNEVVKSSTSSVSSMETIEESEDEDAEEHDDIQEQQQQHEEHVEVAADEQHHEDGVVETEQQENCGEATEELEVKYVLDEDLEAVISVSNMYTNSGSEDDEAEEDELVHEKQKQHEQHKEHVVEAEHQGICEVTTQESQANQVLEEDEEIVKQNNIITNAAIEEPASTSVANEIIVQHTTQEMALKNNVAADETPQEAIDSSAFESSNITSLTPTTITPSDDESSSQESTENDTLTSSQPSSSVVRKSELKRKLSLGSFKTPKRLTKTFMRLNSSKSIASATTE